MINYYIAKLADLIPLCVLAIRLDRKGAPHSRVNVDMVTAAYSLQAKAKLKQQTLQIPKASYGRKLVTG